MTLLMKIGSSCFCWWRSSGLWRGAASASESGNVWEPEIPKKSIKQSCWCWALKLPHGSCFFPSLISNRELYDHTLYLKMQSVKIIIKIKVLKLFSANQELPECLMFCFILFCMLVSNIIQLWDRSLHLEKQVSVFPSYFYLFKSPESISGSNDLLSQKV